jgi:phenylacetate-CoA ligase
MMIVKGVNIYPIQIEKILMQFPQLASDYLITIETIDDNDEMTVEAELAQATDDYGLLRNLSKEITCRLKSEILITPIVKLVGKGVIPQSEGKAKRVNDLRKNF